ncbi:MAG TPA: DUF2306 domain-containing protein [Planctomycetaceae bacterium]|nr:DUF2306 domain-containing protein [Planctomycetaceae bacterium]
MSKNPSKTLPRVLTLVAGLLVLKVTVTVVLNYRHYFPPDFESDFLHGRELYFWGTYRWAFYPHLVCGPVALVLGLIGVSEQFRLRFPKWHRYVGRIQVFVVLFVVCPSGLWMAYRAEGGPIAAVGFAGMAIVTGASAGLGWRAALRRRFAEHRRWMWRCYLSLCSAAVLRLIAGLAAVAAVQGIWLEPLLAWVSWLLPLAAFELRGVLKRRLIPALPRVEPTAVAER